MMRAWWTLLVLDAFGAVIIAKATADRFTCDPTSTTWGDSYCRQILQEGSLCDPNTSRCTNPYASRGCFGSQRVCNSQDDDNSPTLESCTEKPPFGSYTEVRIHAGNWDSSLAMAWIYQIILSEQFQVPVAVVGNSHSSTGTSFYHPQSPLVYAVEAYDWEALEKCHDEQDNHNTLTFAAAQQCVHLLPEVWRKQNVRYQQALQDGSIEGDPLGSSTGIWGQTGWYLPRHTAKAYPALVHYYGLQQTSPQQLADIFQKPWTWEEYCQLGSATRCQEPDHVSLRTPETAQERLSFFVQNLYTGYFGGNNDNQNSNIIGGHIIAPLCQESNIPTAMMEAQLYCNNISLTSHGPLPPNGGYRQEARKQIWKAANATKSHVLMAWWTPDSFVEASREEFQAVTLPPATSTCLQDRPLSTQYCSLDNDLEEQCGPSSEEGVCEGEGHELRKAISTILLKERADMDIVDQSPAYEVIRNLRIPESDLRTLLKEWGTLEAGEEDPAALGFAYREAVCRFVTEHWNEWAEYVVPQGYPRMLRSTDQWTNQPYLVAAQVVGGLAAMAVLILGILTVRFRTRLPFVQAQIHFVWQVLLGFWLVTMAAVVYGKEPSDSRCLLGQYFVTMGFTLVYVPIWVKIANINRIAAQAINKFSGTRSSSTTVVIRIAPIKLFMVEAAVTICVLMYLMVWTAYDPPSRTETRTLHEQADGTSVVETRIQCSSNSDGWNIAALCWEALLLVCATLLAILSQPVVDKFKESRTLGLLVFCQDAFLLLRTVLFLNGGSPSVVSALLSFVLSLNALVSCGIYFIPLFVRIARGEEDTTGFDSVQEAAAAWREMQQQAAKDNDNAAIAHGDDDDGIDSRIQQLTLGSASSGDISILIQNRLNSVNRWRPKPLTAECSRNDELETN